ncbi:14881_t:CDS:2 [Funneliformis geosporum]|uniref:14594_t:CDS:1 n=1 Tax=Funneliformis geosporum TaxID=1117311 RepID=A0A9W4WN72_9GLOM|nr:14594_t:CDS:2 [Funneliformis geosporum]CAI2174936.1 14881_t:CDS:2 [Funneliformis geosporum]
MVFESDAVAYYTFHIISLPLSLTLFILYKNHKHHSTIAYFALTLFISSINSCYLAFANNGNLGDTANTVACAFQAFFVTYLNTSIALWLVCIEYNGILIFTRRRRSRQRLQQNEIFGKNDLLSFMLMSWGLPLFFTITATILAISKNGMEPWLYYCMISKPAIGPAIGIYFVSMCSIIITIILIAWNIKLIYDRESNVDDEIDIDLSRRIIAFGIVTLLPICLATTARLLMMLMMNWVDDTGMWPDFLLVMIPYFTFMIYGTKPEIFRNFSQEPISLSCRQKNRSDNLLINFAIINPTLRRDSIEGRQRNPSLYSSFTKPSSEESIARSVTPGPSTFSQRANSNATDPFSHRKNPSLTINVPGQYRNNRVRKRSSASIRKSFLARALSVNKNSEDSNRSLTSDVESGQVNSRNLRKAMKSLKKPSFRRNMTPPSTHHTIAQFGRSNRNSDDNNWNTEKFLKKFSFENRSKTESVIHIPQELILDESKNYIQDEFKANSSSRSIKLINGHLTDKLPLIEITRNSTSTPSHISVTSDTEGIFDKSEKQRRDRSMKRKQISSKLSRPPPLLLSENHHQQSLSPKSTEQSPSFFFLTSKSNKSTDSSGSSHGGGLRLTPRNSIPVNILNRRSLLDALPRSSTSTINEEN